MSELAEIRGQDSAKRALEIAAAGGHHILLVGPPGSGKTMLGRCLPRLVPGRPFREPPSTLGVTALLGEVERARHGVLFLDEVHQFRRDVLEALRKPMEDHRFLLIATANPCPCGHRGDPRVECACSAQRLTRHRARLSGPWLDRVDLHVEVPAVGLGDLYSGPGESSAVVAERVAAARRVQRERFGEARADPLNGAMDPAALRRYCALDDRGRQLLDAAHRRLGFSARARHRVLKVARTVADLAGKADVDAGHVAEAVQYRSLDRRVEAVEAKT